MSATTKKCSSCKESFINKELVEYRGVNYCRYCLKEKMEREKFQTKVCEIFGLKSPGPVIWKQRKKLLEQGFTDDNLIKCLDYLYNVLGKKKISETLIYVNNGTVGAANAYFKEKEKYESLTNKQVLPEKKEVRMIKPPVKKEIKPVLIDIDSVLNDDDEEW